jgi:hypothetical protein
MLARLDLMQENWREEISDRLEEIRVKEQELHSLEVDLVETQREQKMKEELLKQREAELEEREMTLLQRELNIMIHQQQPQVTTPTPKKRKGKFRKRLLKKEPSTASNSMISGPSDFRHNISLTPSNTLSQTYSFFVESPRIEILFGLVYLDMFCSDTQSKNKILKSAFCIFFCIFFCILCSNMFLRLFQK